ncbi:MAG: HlyD family secretion protein [Verrucomicrobiota bacterium]|jgi:HlyD family secretion protein
MTEPKTKKKSRRKLILATLILIVVAVSGRGFYLHRRDTPLGIQTDKVARRQLTELVVANGRIQPVLQVKISPEVSGEIIDLPVKEGQAVKKGDLLLRIKPDFYKASCRSAEASFKAAESGCILAAANRSKAGIESRRNEDLFRSKLVSDSVFLEVKTTLEVAEASFQAARQQVEVARAALARAEEELAKTTIFSPINGTVSKLTSQSGERVVGTAMMTGTEVMTIANLDDMEARVDIGEIDVVLIATGQIARLEVDAFRDRKFSGVVTEIANSSKGLGQPGGNNGNGGQSQDATRFEVKIRISEKEAFRPGMTVNASIETRSRTNVLTVPFQSVTTRLPKNTNAVPTNAVASSSASSNGMSRADVKAREAGRPIEVVFVLEADQVKALPVTRGISDENFTEILAGLTEGQEIVSGGYKAINRDLEDGKRVKKDGAPPSKAAR